MELKGISEMLNTRYDYMLSVVQIIKPKKLIEVGISRGIRAAQLIQLSQKFNHDIEYLGFDVFDTKDSEFHRIVGNGKKVASMQQIYEFLSKSCERVSLIQGTTEETLWGKSFQGDLVFIDGDHRLESITKDFESLKNSKLIVLDDYYINGQYKEFDTKYYGCNGLVNKFNREEFCISPPSLDLPEIRLVFYSSNKEIINLLNKFFNN